ncbi:hypothetical protein J4Q44_G00048210 [Coregonus suidteri]|uniref:Uncharacterized protein n=1 Tax=Coregonus suidteri TaxID=861788 RepID=A0AAN8M9S3_9TELE
MRAVCVLGLGLLRPAPESLILRCRPGIGLPAGIVPRRVSLTGRSSAWTNTTVLHHDKGRLLEHLGWYK